MRTTTRITKSYTVDPEIDAYVSVTKGKLSASERINALLKRAIMQEHKEKLESEAAIFFAAVQTKERKSTLDFQQAALRTLDRD
jgi:hypothetical protein